MEKVSVGLEGDGATHVKPHYLQVARVLRDKLNGLIAGTEGASGMTRIILDIAAEEQCMLGVDYAASKSLMSIKRGGLKRVAMEGSQTSYCLCCEHEGAMNPALWGTLPQELLHMIFARLPLPGINRLQCLSREWRRNLNTLHSQFNQVCAKVNPSISGLISKNIISKEQRKGVFWVRVFDMKINRWHAFSITVGNEDEDCNVMDAWDGGLVCFMSTSLKMTQYPPRIVVMNLLTRLRRVLHSPRVNLSAEDPRMVQLIVDRQTKCYKVILVGTKIRRGGAIGGLTARVYHSETETWTKPKQSSDLIFGCAYTWNEINDDDYGMFGGPYVCDFAERQLIDQSDCVFDLLQGTSLEASPLQEIASLGDHLYVMTQTMADKNNPEVLSTVGYYISEFHAQKRATDWVKVTTHHFNFLEHPPKREYFIRLHALKGFLMVFACPCEPRSYGLGTPPYECAFGWLYDLSTCKWRVLPNCPDRSKSDLTAWNTLCELQWNIMP